VSDRDARIVRGPPGIAGHVITILVNNQKRAPIRAQAGCLFVAEKYCSGRVGDSDSRDKAASYLQLNKFGGASDNTIAPTVPAPQN
jgi:hypothetical protein